MMKILNKLEIEENIFNLINDTHKNPQITNILNGKKLDASFLENPRESTKTSYKLLRFSL